MNHAAHKLFEVPLMKSSAGFGSFLNESSLSLIFRFIFCKLFKMQLDKNWASLNSFSKWIKFELIDSNEISLSSVQAGKNF